MRLAHTVEAVRDAEAALIRELPQGVLMQRAAVGLAHAILDGLGTAYGGRVLLVVGSGDNGGDALYAGAALRRRGVAVDALILGAQVHQAGLVALVAAGGRQVDGLDDLSGEPDLVVDGVVGIGGRGGLRAEAATVFERLAGIPVVAVDVPSGVDVDTGETSGEHVRAAVTVTFGTHKIAHLVEPAASACGSVELVDIGLTLPPAPVESLQPNDVARMLPRPAPDAQKYGRGVVGVRAGSGTYAGAAALCVAGANSGLVGMVRYVAPRGSDLAGHVRARFPETVGAGQVQAWVVGPGGGDTAGEELAAALADEVPVVVDADALAHVRAGVDRPAVLTPHAGELAAMLGVDRCDVEARQLHFARLASEQYDCVVLLKGRHTLIARPDGRVRVTTTGVPWLATAGAGDVLAGLVGALLAARLDAFDAASVGSWLHGAAATLASDGGPLVATDVAHAIRSAVAAIW